MCFTYKPRVSVTIPKHAIHKLNMTAGGLNKTNVLTFLIGTPRVHDILLIRMTVVVNLPTQLNFFRIQPMVLYYAGFHSAFNTSQRSKDLDSYVYSTSLQETGPRRKHLKVNKKCYTFLMKTIVFTNLTTAWYQRL